MVYASTVTNRVIAAFSIATLCSLLSASGALGQAGWGEPLQPKAPKAQPAPPSPPAPAPEPAPESVAPEHTEASPDWADAPPTEYEERSPQNPDWVEEDEPPPVGDQPVSASAKYDIRYANRSLTMPRGMMRGTFDVVVSSFAIHHCTNDRKQTLYREILDRLAPDGVFCNLEHVASPSENLHQRFLNTLGITSEDEDEGNILLDVETQLTWLREVGFNDVDCYWKWLELCLFGGIKPEISG